MKRDSSRFPIVIATLMLAMGAAATTSLYAANNNPGIAPSNSNSHGASYGEWGARWWQWVFSLPIHTNGQVTHPLLTNGPVDCSLGQTNEHVWFLAGRACFGALGDQTGCGNNSVSAERSCRVPTGTALFFPIFNTEADNTGFTEPTTFSTGELAGFAASGLNMTELHASINGAPIRNLSSYRAAFAPFGYTIPAQDNFLQAQGADVPGSGWPYGTFVSPAASDGYWLLIEPLPPGTYVINSGGTNTFGFQVNITYTITVVPRGRF